MIKPQLHEYHRPTSISEFPTGPSFQAGHLVSTNSNYRTSKPVICYSKCIKCLLCYVACPDGAIIKNDKFLNFDYDFCKGCGICSKECKVKAIRMEREQ